MSKRIQVMRQLFRRTYAEITHSKEEWRRYLQFCTRFYKYDFTDIIGIYAVNPNTTMCADYDTLNEQGRRINAQTKAFLL